MKPLWKCVGLNDYQIDLHKQSLDKQENAMTNEDNQITFFVGAVITSVAVGYISGSAPWGFLFFGITIMIVSSIASHDKRGT